MDTTKALGGMTKSFTEAQKELEQLRASHADAVKRYKQVVTALRGILRIAKDPDIRERARIGLGVTNAR